MVIRQPSVPPVMLAVSTSCLPFAVYNKLCVSGLLAGAVCHPVG